MRDDMHSGRVEPEEERLVVLSCLVEEFERVRQYFVVNCLHALGAEFTGVLYLLLSDLAPTRLDRGIIHIGGPAMHHVARANCSLECWWIIAVAGILHRIEVVEVPVEFIEAVRCRKELVAVAK